MCPDPGGQSSASSPSPRDGDGLPAAADSSGCDDSASSVPRTPYFDVKDLNAQERNLLVFMSFCSYLDWQERFLESYKEVLMNRATQCVSKDSSECYALYTALRDSLVEQRSLFKPADDSAAGAGDSEIDPNEPSVFRQVWRTYRVEVYLKIVLLIFLLKLPPLCYMVVTMLYVAYVLTAASLVRLPYWAIANRRLTRSLVFVARWFDRIISPFVSLGRSGAGARRGADGVRGGSGSARASSTAGASGASPGAGSARAAPRQSSSTHHYTLSDVASLYREPEARAARRAKPSFLTRAAYQLFAAYLLSFFPWWEPNPIFIDDSD